MYLFRVKCNVFNTNVVWLLKLFGSKLVKLFSSGLLLNLNLVQWLSWIYRFYLIVLFSLNYEIMEIKWFAFFFCFWYQNQLNPWILKSFFCISNPAQPMHPRKTTVICMLSTAFLLIVSYKCLSGANIQKWIFIPRNNWYTNRAKLEMLVINIFACVIVFFLIIIFIKL